MIIISFDSGLEKTGYAIFQKKENKPYYINSGLISTSKNVSLEKRLLSIYKQSKLLFNKYKPNKVVIEKLFYFKNQKTFIQVAQTQGVIILLTAKYNIQLNFMTPLQIKQIITGYGKSDKKSIQKMIKLQLNIDIKQDDEADAIACGLSYCYLNQNLI